MQDYERNILEQYYMDVNSTRKIRGAVLCDTRQGLFLLKEVSVSESRIPALCELYTYLMEKGCCNVDYILANKEGEYISQAEDGGKYLVKRWFAGRECDMRNSAELLEASGNLAKIHILMKKEMEQKIAAAEDLRDVYLRHDRELKKVRKFMRGISPKGEFEFAFLRCFEQMYRWAEAAGNLLESSGYDRLYRDSMDSFCMTHGEYNYHNVLMMREEVRPSIAAVTNFDKFKRDIQVEDLYYFLRKVMEKHGWKERLGDNMLNAYSAIKPLTEAEIEYIKIRLIYPEKFWKIASSYYHSNKAWISVKSVEKLNTAIWQTREKERFLEHIFSFFM